MFDKISGLIVTFPPQFIKDKVKTAGYRVTSQNISLVLQGIKQELVDTQLVSSLIDKVIKKHSDNLSTTLDNDGVKPSTEPR